MRFKNDDLLNHDNILNCYIDIISDMSIKNFDRLDNIVGFPLIRTLEDGKQLIIDIMKEENVDSVFELFMKYAADGDRISVVSIFRCTMIRSEYTMVSSYIHNVSYGTLMSICDSPRV